MTITHALYAFAGLISLGAIPAALAVWHELAYRRARGLILALLEPRVLGCTGVEMVAASNRKLGRGTVYVWLDRMEDEGLIRSWTDPEADPALAALGVLPLRRYRLKEAT